MLQKRSKCSFRFLFLGLLYKLINKKTGSCQLNYLNEEKWDVLIVLDACRYDYFKKNYKKHLKGELKALHSPASGTIGWFKKTFNKKYPNIKLLSTNPHINSQGIEILGYKATDHFKKDYIIDVWDYGWNKKLNTVHPEILYKESLKHYDSSKKNIFWFMQPHGPWIGEPSIITSSKNPIEGNDEAVISKIRKKQLSKEDFKKAYEGNLKLALKYVEKLINNLPQNITIFITSDHGELLGEYNSYLHYYDLSAPELRKVPLLKIVK